MAAALQSLALRLPEGRMAREMASLWSSLGRTPSDDRKWRYDAIEALLRHRLLTLPDVDAQVAEVRPVHSSMLPGARLWPVQPCQTCSAFHPRPLLVSLKHRAHCILRHAMSV